MDRSVGDIVRVEESVEESGVYSLHSFGTVIIEGIDQVVSTSRIETDLVVITETGPSDENTELKSESELESDCWMESHYWMEINYEME